MIHIILLVLSILYTQVCVIFAGCSIMPNVEGHVDIPISWNSIKERAFFECSILVSVNIPDNVKFIAEKAFASCHGLKT